MSALAGRRALVTGGTQGAGAAIVSVLRREGAAVVATARHGDPITGAEHVIDGGTVPTV